MSDDTTSFLQLIKLRKNKVSSRKISVQSLFYPYSKLILLRRSVAYSGIFSVNRVPTGTQLLHVCTRNVKTYAYDDSNIIIIIIIIALRTTFKDCCHQSRAITRVSWDTWWIENSTKAVTLLLKNSNLCEKHTSTSRTDRRMDRRLTVAWPRSCVASYGKNQNLEYNNNISVLYNSVMCKNCKLQRIYYTRSANSYST